MALVCGRPRRKSAKSTPVTAPVKPKLPRGSCWPNTSLLRTRNSPPVSSVWSPCVLVTVPAQRCVCSVAELYCPSASAAISLENESDGGPQLRGSSSPPEIPAAPETFTRLAKCGTVSLSTRVNPYLALIVVLRLRIHVQVA